MGLKTGNNSVVISYCMLILILIKEISYTLLFIYFSHLLISNFQLHLFLMQMLEMMLYLFFLLHNRFVSLKYDSRNGKRNKLVWNIHNKNKTYNFLIINTTVLNPFHST